jgi:hypothetical protein
MKYFLSGEKLGQVINVIRYVGCDIVTVVIMNI